MTALIPAADWLRLHITVAGTPLARQPFQRTVLDISRGVLMTETRAGSLPQPAPRPRPGAWLG
jgi:hypothetical protein